MVHRALDRSASWWGEPAEQGLEHEEPAAHCLVRHGFVLALIRAKVSIHRPGKRGDAGPFTALREARQLGEALRKLGGGKLIMDLRGENLDAKGLDLTLHRIQGVAG
jgi:hypothetical protein